MAKSRFSARQEVRTDVLPGLLLDWFGRNRRALAWRARPGERADPYRVWLSEIMLQQTTIATVEPYFRRFVARWPTVQALAAAELDDVLHLWQGLGYYARARNLHRCARIVAGEHGGRFPDDEDALRALPGIGAYTAAAIRAIAFGRRAVALDGNVERVMARLFRVETALPEAKPELRALAAGLAPVTGCGDYTQAVMELGQTICTARAPSCLVCPWAAFCAGREGGIAETLPRRAARAARPTRRGVAFWAVREDGAILLRRRPEKGLLGGMMEIPSTEWRTEPWSARAARASAPFAAKWRLLDGIVEHSFTHFHLELAVMAAQLPGDADADGTWCAPERMGELALPTVMKKVVRHAIRRTEEK